jgi:hypothetical protein
MSIPGAVIDSYAKSGLPGSAARADSLLAKMIHLHQLDPVNNAELCPNTYVFNTGEYSFSSFFSYVDVDAYKLMFLVHNSMK